MIFRKQPALYGICLFACCLLLPVKQLWAQSQPQAVPERLLKELETARPDTGKLKYYGLEVHSI